MLDLGDRRLSRHKHLYRTVNLPFAAVRGWESVESVKVFYDQDLDQVVIRPKVGDQARAKAPLNKNTKPATEEIHTPGAHFSF